MCKKNGMRYDEVRAIRVWDFVVLMDGEIVELMGCFQRYIGTVTMLRDEYLNLNISYITTNCWVGLK